ncbi:hypothetical protein KBC99_01970 [Candidatus Saccharibacteria bacterium]|nr:hypothetical protein [Candidatus Saccharibacteria bacterium]
MIEGIRLVKYHYQLQHFDVAPQYFSLTGTQSQNKSQTVYEYQWSEIQATKDTSTMIHHLQGILRDLPGSPVCSASVTKAFVFDAPSNTIVGYAIEIQIEGRWLNLFNPKAQSALSLHAESP